MPSILLIGASRGLGHAMAAEFVKRQWNVVGTVRKGSTQTALHDLAANHSNQVEIETLDINEPDQLSELKQRLSGRTFDILFVNAGTTNKDPSQTIGEVTTEEFIHVMTTNALSPMRVVEKLEGLVTPSGTIGVMSSGQGSIANNTMGQREVYRGTKAALNQYMRSFAARQSDTARALVTMAPGWVKTELGGEDARFTMDEVIPSFVDVLLEKTRRPGLEFLDWQGKTVPW